MARTLLQLQKRRDDALKAVATATTPNARAAAASDLEKASLDLATFQARIESKRVVTTVRREEEEESASESEEEESSESSESKEPKKPLEESESSASEEEEEESESSSSSSSSSSSGSESMEEEEEDEEKARAMLGSRSGVYTYERLFLLAQQVTGKRSVQEVFGALDGMGVRLQAMGKLEARLDKLEGKNRREKVDRMLADAQRGGKITEQSIASLRAKGMDDPKWLKGHLSALPKSVRTIEDGGLRGRTLSGEKDGDRRRAEILDAQNMSADQRNILEAAAASAGMTFDAYLDKRNEMATSTSGARRRGA